MKYTFKIFRFDPSTDQMPYFQEYEFGFSLSTSILEALITIRNELDGTLSFRYSCRGAVCGSCGMIINGKPDLACGIKIGMLNSREIVLEPLPNFEVLKDLVVDMEPFWKANREIKPYLHPTNQLPEKEHRVSEKQIGKIYQFINCVLCACCYSACPVVARDESYLGPAALAKLYRFIQDPRDTRSYSFLKEINTQEGVWGCDTVFKCIEACPKEVRPVDAIEGLRRKLVIEKIKRFFRLGK
ncbi:MAG: succinate dehydrogenase/fumarate reductase iron-sulfur subunit [Candidatus Aminicenantia bacterium]